MRKPIPRKVREEVYAKYDGHCAYCGCELKYEEMQVDHIESVYITSMHNGWKDTQNDSIDNLMPACRMCNYYKSIGDIETFRSNLQETLMRNVRRPFDYRLAVKYGLVVEDIKPIKFYFEREHNEKTAMQSDAAQ